MKKIERTVWKETVYVALWTLILSVLMQAVFLVLNKWNLTVLSGNALGAIAAVLNFFLMAYGVQTAVAKEDAKESKKVLQLSHSLRLLLLAVFAALGAWLPWFNTIAVLVPLLFPQIGVLFRPKFGKMDDQEGGA